jgi:hypothetical protein
MPQDGPAASAPQGSERDIACATLNPRLSAQSGAPEPLRKPAPVCPRRPATAARPTTCISRSSSSVLMCRSSSPRTLTSGRPMPPRPTPPASSPVTPDARPLGAAVPASYRPECHKVRVGIRAQMQMGSRSSYGSPVILPRWWDVAVAGPALRREARLRRRGKGSGRVTPAFIKVLEGFSCAVTGPPWTPSAEIPA